MATLALLAPFALAVFAAGRGDAGHRLVAIALASSLATFLFVTLDFVIDQASSIDLALALALLILPGTLLFALFEERWL
ncbi:MAG: hypothetical protein JOY99_10495 [Sphingomonadaceae bacterium]|nr:hypothetical protein [Sphingomonadaceae bacterium]